MFRLTSDIRCRGCGYSLRGLESQRCPECGRPFDPKDPTTYAHEVLDGRQLFLGALIAAGFFAVPLIWVISISFIRYLLAWNQSADGLIIYISLFVWLIFPAVGFLVAKDIFIRFRAFKKEGRGLTEHEHLAKVGHRILQTMVLGMLLILALLLGLAVFAALSSL